MTPSPQLEKILAGTLAGTSIMTASSYALSNSMKEQFREPVILSILLKRLLKQNDKGNHLTGWILHYSVGLFFNTVYDRIWNTTRFRPTIGNGLLLGAISGLIGFSVWKTTFRLHPNPPRLDFEKYYAQIVAVHLVFGIFSALGYRKVPVHTKEKEVNLRPPLKPTIQI